MKKLFTSRRNFLKTTTTGAAGLAVGGVGVKKVRAQTGLAWQDGMQINAQGIDNLRVACCYDESMIPSRPTQYENNLSNQNALVDEAKVFENMDRLAMALADNNDPLTAWRKIFTKPDTKNSWEDVQVAIKVNCIEDTHVPRASIIKKVCMVLNEIDSPGVPFGNITIFDAKSNCTSRYDTTAMRQYLPDNVNIENGLGGSKTISLPEGQTSLLASDLDGNIDIFVNIAVNKGHSQPDKGAFTLCLKNLYGVYNPKPGSYPKPNGCGNLDYLFDIYKSESNIGGTPARNQLCIVDSLWAMRNGPKGSDNEIRDRIAMGTFGPAVDYLVAKKIRVDVMDMTSGSYSVRIPETDRFLTDFGYDLSSNEVQNLDFVDAMQYTAVSTQKSAKPTFTNTLSFKVNSPTIKTTSIKMKIPERNNSIDILSLNGKMIRKLNLDKLNSNKSQVIWDGKDNRGKLVDSGKYVLRCKNGKRVISKSFQVIK